MFSDLLIPVPVGGRWNLPPAAQGARQVPPPAGQPSSAGPLASTVHSLRPGGLQTGQSTSRAHLCDEGGNWSTRGSPRSHEDNVQTPHRRGPLPGIGFVLFFVFFFINVITKWRGGAADVILDKSD